MLEMVNGCAGFTKDGYAYYKDFATAALMFGDYVRHGDPYIASPALTMADLETHNGWNEIFIGASTKGLATYNQLKACLEKRVTLSDISNATRTLRASQIKEMSSTITSSINKQRAVNKSISGR